MFRIATISLTCILSLVVSQTFAFGPDGHHIVGSIADQRLAATPTATKVNALLGGLTLEKAAVIPDTLKSYNGHPNSFVLHNHPELTNQLRAYLKANPKSAPKFNHHDYHYTDVPVEGNSKYDTGTIGRSDVDVVHMMKFCIGVLNGTESADNPRKITKPVAVILLAHFLGDIHQPLHVGAEYFDNSGKPMNPDVQSGPYNKDIGGNNLTLHIRDASGDLKTVGNLHHYWDDTAVDTAFGLLREEILASGGGASGIDEDEIAKYLASKTPTGFSTPASPIGNWSEEWANEILPLAKTAHSRLKFSHMMINTRRHTASGQATEKPIGAGTVPYADFAGKVTRDNIHKAGWRLALVLEKSL